MKTVIFDLDGTLANTSGDLIESANACFRHMGHGDVLNVADDATTAMMGGGRAMLKAGFQRLGLPDDDDAILPFYPMLLDAYEANIDVHTFLYPGCVAALDSLKASGHLLGVCTNKPERLAEILLTRLGIREYFGALVGADTLTVRKPDPAPLWASISRLGGKPERSVLIGDSPTDRNTAKSADVISILVTFGPDGQNVASLQPEALLHHYDDLDNVMQTVLT